MHHLLLIEGNPGLAHLLTLDLQDAGYRVSCTSNMASGLIQLQQKPPALIVLDLERPNELDYDVLLQIRRQSDLPIIALTSQSDLDSKRDLLNLEADDHLLKPFTLKELLACIALQLKPLSGTSVRLGALVISVTPRQVSYAGKEVLLSPIEFQLLQLLSRKPGQVYSKQEICAELWGGERHLDTNLLSVHMARLRRKLGAARGVGLIRTVRGLGYAMRTPIS